MNHSDQIGRCTSRPKEQLLMHFSSAFALAAWVCAQPPGVALAEGAAEVWTWRRLWSYEAGAPLAGAPTRLEDGWVVASTNGQVAALGADGRKRWTFALGSGAPVGSAAVAGRTVIVAGAGGTAIGLDAADGRRLWQADLGLRWIHGPLAVSGESNGWRVALLSRSDGVLHCLDAANGRLLWRSKPTNRSDGPPAGNGRVLVYGNCDAGFHVVGLADGGTLAWIPVGEDGGQMAGGVLLREGRAWAGTYGGELVCADLTTGAVAWRSRVSDKEAFVTPATQGGLVIAAGADGTVAAFDAESGVARWRASPGGAVSALCVAGDAVAAAVEGRLVALRLRDGASAATIPVGDEIAGPVCHGYVVAVADDLGRVLGLTLDTGKGTKP
jgi:outer membrane protein assembly factor BamB